MLLKDSGEMGLFRCYRAHFHPMGVLLINISEFEFVPLTNGHKIAIPQVKLTLRDYQTSEYNQSTEIVNSV